jgi:hypothetical protein
MSTEEFPVVMTNDETGSTDDIGHDLYSIIQLMGSMYMVLSKYIWMVPVVFGIPGNMISIVVATREHNRHLSPCVYMSAMAVIDTMLLINTAWFVPIIFWNLAPDASLKARELMFKYVQCTTYM